MMRQAPERAVRRTGRIAFANQLRGVAAVLVACSHLIGVYCDQDLRGAVAAATFSPVQAGGMPGIYRLISYQWFEFGPFGVALFFLISGMVIPFSLDKHTRRTFLIARVLRIYPTFILALLFEVLVLHSAAHYWRRAFTYGAGTIMSNLFLVNSLTGSPVIDFVNWTLAIEVKFYLVVMVLATAIRSGKTGALFGVSIAIVIAEYLIALNAAAYQQEIMAPLLHAFSLESPYVIFMFIGVLFNFHDTGHLGAPKLLASVLAMGGLFIAAWRLSALGPEYPVVTVNYLYAIALFGGLYAVRHRIKENRVLDFIAAISYPFYLIHAVIGFTVMKYFMVTWHFGYYASLACAVITIISIAFFLHRTIETKTITMGHRLAKRPNLPIRGGPTERRGQITIIS